MKERILEYEEQRKQLDEYIQYLVDNFYEDGGPDQ